MAKFKIISFHNVLGYFFHCGDPKSAIKVGFAVQTLRFYLQEGRLVFKDILQMRSAKNRP